MTPPNRREIAFFGEKSSMLLSNVGQNGMLICSNFIISRFVERLLQDRRRVFCLRLSSPKLTNSIRWPCRAPPVVGLFYFYSVLSKSYLFENCCNVHACDTKKGRLRCVSFLILSLPSSMKPDLRTSFPFSAERSLLKERYILCY